MSHATVLIAIDGDVERGDIDNVIAEQMAPFNEGESFFKNGSRWDWYVIGGRWSGLLSGLLLGQDVRRKGELNLTEMQEQQRRNRREGWEEAQAIDEKHREFLTGVRSGESLEEYIERGLRGYPLSCYAFLRNKRWNERERMGWWGCPAKTECEIKGHKVKRCLTRNKKTGAAIVTWNEDEDIWSQKFFDRFIRDLDDDTWLVIVDYHV